MTTILLVDAPGLHLGYLGFYGNVWAATPNLDHLASESVVFDHHYAAGPDSLITGLYCFPEPEAQARESKHWFDESKPSLALRALKFHLIEPVPKPAKFDEQVPPRQLQRIVKTLTKARPEEPTLVWARLPSLAPADGTFRKGCSKSASKRARKRTCSSILRSVCPNRLWAAPLTGEELERLQDTYAAAVAFLDEQIGGWSRNWRSENCWIVCCWC